MNLWEARTAERDWRHSLEAGDSVALAIGYNSAPQIMAVTKVTPTRFRVPGHEFKKDTGEEYGARGYSRAQAIQPDGAAHLALIKEFQVREEERRAMAIHNEWCQAIEAAMHRMDLDELAELMADLHCKEAEEDKP